MDLLFQMYFFFNFGMNGNFGNFEMYRVQVTICKVQKKFAKTFLGNVGKIK